MEPATNNKPLRLGVLLSGRGSNFLAIAESVRSGRLPGVEIAIVISNIAEAPGFLLRNFLAFPRWSLFPKAANAPSTTPT